MCLLFFLLYKLIPPSDHHKGQNRDENRFSQKSRGAGWRSWSSKLERNLEPVSGLVNDFGIIYKLPCNPSFTIQFLSHQVVPS